MICWGKVLYPEPDLSLEGLEVGPMFFRTAEELNSTAREALRLGVIPPPVRLQGQEHCIGYVFQGTKVELALVLKNNKDPGAREVPWSAPEVLHGLYSRPTREWLAAMKHYGRIDVVQKLYERVNRLLSQAS